MNASKSYQLALSAVDGITAPFRSADKATNRLKESVSKLEGEARNLKGLERSAKSAMQWAAKVEEADKSAKAAATRLGELERAYKEAEKPTKKMTTELERARAAALQASAVYDKQSTRLGKLTGELKKAGYETDDLSAAQRKLQSQLQNSNARLDAQKDRLKALNAARAARDKNAAARSQLRGDLMETAAMGYFMAQPVQRAIEFESQFADVKKVVTFAGSTDEEREASADKFSREILRMSGDMSIDAGGISQIVAAAGQSGVAKSEEELLSFAQSAAKMAVAFDQSADVAGSTMAAWRSSMGLSQDQAVSLAAATNHLSNNMNATAGDIAAVMRRQGATAMSAGLDEVQVASLSAALLSGGASEEVAATALKNITGALMKGDQATARQSDAFAKLGFDPEDLAASMIADAPTTLVEVMEALQDVPEDEVSAVVSALFGEEVKGSVMPLLKNLDNLRGAFKLTADSSAYATSLEDEYTARSKTRANDLAKLSNKFDRLQIVMGSLLLPALDTVLTPVAAFADILSDSAESYPAIAEAIMTAGVGLVAVKAGALALKFVGLQFGQGFNFLKLGRAKFGAAMGGTETSTRRATSALRRFGAVMDGLGRRGAGPWSGASAGRRGVGPSAGPRSGRRGRLLGGLASGAALGVGGMVPDAGLVADAAGGVESLVGGRSKFARLASKGLRPLAMAMGAWEMFGAYQSGSAGKMAEAGGGMLGGLGGAAAGAALGSMVLPGVGTLIGGALGSIGGDAIGEWFGGSIGRLFSDDEKSAAADPAQPAAVSSRSAKTFAPVINVTVPNGMDPKQVAEFIRQEMEASFRGMSGEPGVVDAAAGAL